MSARSIIRTLHFRITILFLLLLSLFFVAYTWWVDRTMYTFDYAEGEKEWSEEAQDAEMDSLALLISDMVGNQPRLDEVFVDYGARIADFDVELTLLSSEGLVLTTTIVDTLSDLKIRVQPAVLDSMTTDEWDFAIYPVPEHMSAFANRITRVLPIHADGDTLSEPTEWLAETFRPIAYIEGELESDDRVRMFQGAAVVLLYSFLVGLILLNWVSRRVRNLSTDMATFRKGDFDHRAISGQGDEISRLGHDFNRLADRLTEVIGELKQSEEYRRQLVANISHDLRTPMATLRSYVETFLLKWNTLTESDRERQLNTITSNLDNLEAMIERLFELTQLDSGRVKYHSEVFPLEELAADVLNRISVKAEHNNVTLELISDNQLPLVQADPVRIGQVLQNLLGNAIKFNGDGGHVWLHLEPADEGVVIAVSDDGKGISQEDLPHVFERFYTADKSRTSKGQGSGLGLAIAHTIVKAHQGELTVESREPGSGAVFRFTLPAAVLDAD